MDIKYFARWWVTITEFSGNRTWERDANTCVGVHISGDDWLLIACEAVHGLHEHEHATFANLSRHTWANSSSGSNVSVPCEDPASSPPKALWASARSCIKKHHWDTERNNNRIRCLCMNVHERHMACQAYKRGVLPSIAIDQSISLLHMWMLVGAHFDMPCKRHFQRCWDCSKVKDMLLMVVVLFFWMTYNLT